MEIPLTPEVKIALVLLAITLLAIVYVVIALVPNRRAMNRAIREREEVRRDLETARGTVSRGRTSPYTKRDAA